MCVGSDEGSELGLNVGCSVGRWEGRSEGSEVGSNVGCLVGVTGREGGEGEKRKKRRKGGVDRGETKAAKRGWRDITQKLRQATYKKETPSGAP